MATISKHTLNNKYQRWCILECKGNSKIEGRQSLEKNDQKGPIGIWWVVRIFDEMK